MEYIYAALLLYKAGKEITEDSVVSILEAAGVNVNETRVKALISALDGVNIEEAISKASLFSTPATAVANTENNNVVESNNKPTEQKEEEPDHSEEDGMAGLGALFG